MAGQELDFRDNTPAAGAGYQLGKFQKGPTSGNDPVFGLPIYPLSTEVPASGSVSKLTTNATAAAGDCGKLLSFTLSGASTYTLPATPPSVPDGGGTNRWQVGVQNQAASTAALTIAATTPAKLDGVTAGTLALAAGSGVALYTDGTDYFTERGLTVGGITQLTGDVTAGPGSGSQVATLTASGVTAGTYPKVTVDAKGRVTAGTALSPSDLPLATSSAVGAVKPDTTSISVDGSGNLSVIGSAVTKGVYTGNTAYGSMVGSPTSPITAAFGSSVKAGNAILVFVGSSSAITISSVTDSLGNSYAFVLAESTWPQECYIALNCAGGADTVTVNFTGGGTKVSVRAVEYQNVVGVSAVDVSTSASTGGGSVVASFTTTNASDVLVAHAMLGGTGTSSWTAGYTQQIGSVDGALNWTDYLVDANVTSAGAQSLTWTNGAPFASHSVIFLALKVGTGVQDFNGRTGHIVAEPAGAIVLQIDGGGSTPALGAKGGALQMPYAGTITGWTLLADASGSGQITVSKTNYASFPTTSSIDASAPPNLSGAQKATSTTLTGWTTSFSAGDIFTFNLDSASAVTKLTLILQTQRTL